MGYASGDTLIFDAMEMEWGVEHERIPHNPYIVECPVIGRTKLTISDIPR